jgi:hypothetical protein
VLVAAFLQRPRTPVGELRQIIGATMRRCEAQAGQD